jgi:hypothetical protein
MASSGDGARYFSSLGLVRRRVATTLVRDGPSRRGSGIRHAPNVEMTEIKAVIVEEAWDCSIGPAKWQRST